MKHTSSQTDKIFYSVIPSPLGLIGIASTSKGLCRIKLQVASQSAFYDELIAEHHTLPEIKETQNLKKQFDLYFAGKLREFTCPLDLEQGTPFQKKVWRKLISIPYGTTRSYEWLAKSIGNANACRAVGNANGQNPIPIIIPCHRIVRKNGDLGGYAGGSQIKQSLLNLEKPHASL